MILVISGVLAMVTPLNVSSDLTRSYSAGANTTLPVEIAKSVPHCSTTGPGAGDQETTPENAKVRTRSG